MWMRRPVRKLFAERQPEGKPHNAHDTTSCCAACDSAHDEGIQNSQGLVGHPERETQQLATLPMRMGGLGLRSAVRCAPAAFWASWSDHLETCGQHHGKKTEECETQLPEKWSRSHSQEHCATVGPAVKAATLSTRAGCECIAHALQAVTELDWEATVTTIDGTSACDSISWRAMLLGHEVARGQALPFVQLFHCELSAYLWEDASGTVHTVHQGEGGEQSDPLMPLLFSVGQHAALEAIQRKLPTEKLLAFLDDIHVVSRPE